MGRTRRDVNFREPWDEIGDNNVGFERRGAARRLPQRKSRPLEQGIFNEGSESDEPAGSGSIVDHRPARRSTGDDGDEEEAGASKGKKRRRNQEFEQEKDHLSDANAGGGSHVNHPPDIEGQERRGDRQQSNSHLTENARERREENGGSDSEEEEDEEDEEGEEGQDDDDASGLRKERTKMLHRLRKSTRLGRQPQGMGRVTRSRAKELGQTEESDYQRNRVGGGMGTATVGLNQNESRGEGREEVGLERMLSKKSRKRRSAPGYISDDSIDDRFGPALESSLADILGGGQAFGGQAERPNDTEHGLQGGKASGQQDAEITPLHVDPSITFDCVGGLNKYVKALKEMVFLPLMYPEVFERFQVVPPRGVLLHGPPGTGKTLLARALAASCERAGTRVAFFMRKGADVLSKWVGESERQLRLLFEEAQKHQPSIVFFDEIDGLAPLRSSKQDQIHNSVVSTLLAHMDGLSSRGQVVVIGSTNRPDAVDAALRRPGRFDRELAFPLPDEHGRLEILKVHTRDWQEQPSEEVLQHLAAECVGYCGADLKALCTEAAVRALRRRYPQIYRADKKLRIDPNQVKVELEDFESARSSLTPAAHRSTNTPARPLPPMLKPLMGEVLDQAKERLQTIFPPAADGDEGGFCLPRIAGKDDKKGSDNAGNENPQLLMSSFFMAQRSRLLICGTRGSGQLYLGPALLHAVENFSIRSIALPSLLSDSNTQSAEQALVQAFSEARRSAPSVLFLPHAELWWESASEMLKCTLHTLLEDTPPDVPLLLLSVADCPINDLDEDFASIFGGNDQILDLDEENLENREAFFGQLVESIVEAKDNVTQDDQADGDDEEVLPVAEEQPSAQTGTSSVQVSASREEEEQFLRRLRMVLRVILEKVVLDRRFRFFSAPPSETNFPGYYDQVNQPMDLATLLWQLNEGCYPTLDHFFADFTLIKKSAQEYFGNPPATIKGTRMVNFANELEDIVCELVEQKVSKEMAAKCAAIVRRREASGEEVAAKKRFPAQRRRSREDAVQTDEGGQTGQIQEEQAQEAGESERHGAEGGEDDGHLPVAQQENNDRSAEPVQSKGRHPRARSPFEGEEERKRALQSYLASATEGKRCEELARIAEIIMRRVRTDALPSEHPLQTLERVVPSLV